MNKNLVSCPNCKREILGEIDESGDFLIMRFHKGLTKITGRDFAVTCGQCNEKVFIRKIPDRLVRGTVVNYLHTRGNIQQEVFSKISGEEPQLGGGSSGIWGTT